MKQNVNRIITAILCLCLVLSFTACNSEVPDATGSAPEAVSSNASDSSVADGDNSDSQNSNDDAAGDSNSDTVQSVNRYVDGSYTTQEAASDAFEYVAPDGYAKMSSESDAAADALRNKILSAKDTHKATGVTYYFSTDGDDNNDGLSEATPLRTLQKLQDLELNPGDAVLLKRGCIFRTTTTIRLTSGIYFGAYGEGDKPEIRGSAQNYAGKNLWRPYGDKKNFWVLDFYLSDAGNIVFDYGALVGKKYNNVMVLQSEGDFYHDQAGAIYLYSEKNPNTDYKSIEIGTHVHLLTGPDDLHDVTIENICVGYTGGHGLNFTHSKNITITNCEFKWIGGCWQVKAGGQRYGNAVQFWHGGENISVTNCWIHKVFDAGLTWQGAYDWINVAFENNLIEYTTLEIETWGSSPTANNATKLIKNISIRNNICRFAGSRYAFGEERPDNARGAFITFSSGHYDLTDIMFDYIVEDNIFDISDTYVYYHLWLEPFTEKIGESLVFRNNTYYMSKRSWTDVVMQMGAYLGANINYSTKATNQAELEAAIMKYDKTPKLIKWIG